MTPIHKTTEVPLTCQEAFDLFLADMDVWWPKDSNATLGPDAKIIVEPCKDGDIKEVGPDGTINLWGRIIGWEPGHYMSFAWFPDTDEEHATVVSVSFHPTKNGTRLELTHGGFDVLGDTADAVSTSYLLGWDLVLGTYCYAVSKTVVFA